MKDLRWLIPFAVIVFLGSAGVNGGPHGQHLGHDQWACVIIAVAAAAAAGGSRRAPALAVVVTGLLVAGYFLLDGQGGPVYLTLPVTVLAAAWLWPVRRWAGWTALAVLLADTGVLIGPVSSGSGAGVSVGPGDGLGSAIALLAISAAAGAIGARVRDRGLARAERAKLAATREQLRMAQDLHDGVGHGLAVIAMQAGVALHVLDKDPPAARASLEAIRDTSREALDALRAELTKLRPGREPAERTPRPGLEELDVLVARVRAGGLDVTMERPAAAEPPPEVGEAVYAVVQEALTNVLRHAEATTATVTCATRDDVLLVTVVDNGRDGTPGPYQDRGDTQTEGMGISGMRRRVEHLGGILEVGPVAGGFRVAASLPLGTTEQDRPEGEAS